MVSAKLKIINPNLSKAFQSLKNNRFYFLWLGQAVSNIGDNFHQIALVWWVIKKGGSPEAMGYIVALTYTPLIIFSLLGGVIVDRFSRAHLMLFSDIARAVIVAIITWLDFREALQIWHIYLLSLFFGFVDAFFRPAYTALVPQIVPKDNLSSANSLTELSREISNMIGPLIGATLIDSLGTASSFGLNSLSFAISAVCLLFIKNTPVHDVKNFSIKSYYLSLKEGFSIVINSAWLWVTIVIFSLVNIAISGSYKVALPFFVKENLQDGVHLLGLLYALTSVGAIFAGLYWGNLKKHKNRGYWSYMVTGLMGLMLIALGNTHSIIIASFSIFIFGFSKTSFRLLWMSSLQDTVHHQKLGRVFSIDLLGSYILLPLGLALAGWGSDHIGAAYFIIISGVSVIILTLLGLTHPQVRRFD